MLSNAYFLAKFRFDTAENEPAKNLQNFANFPNFANRRARTADDAAGARRVRGGVGEDFDLLVRASGRNVSLSKWLADGGQCWQNFQNGGNYWRARCRLYVQKPMFARKIRFAGFVKIYRIICSVTEF